MIGKFTSNKTVTNPWLFNFVWSFFIIILILPFALINHVGIPVFTPDLVLVGVFYAAANILYIVLLQLMEVTAMGPLFNFRTVFSVILGIILLGESVTPLQILLIWIIFIAGIIVNIDEKLKLKAFFRPVILLFMIFMLVLSFWGIYTNKAIAQSGFWATTLWSIILAQIIFLFSLPLFVKDLVKTRIKKYSGLLLMSIASAGGVLAANQAFSVNVSITSTIVSLPFSMIFTIIISTIKPKLLEHHTARIYTARVIAAAVMLIAALRLSG